PRPRIASGRRRGARRPRRDRVRVPPIPLLQGGLRRTLRRIFTRRRVPRGGRLLPARAPGPLRRGVLRAAAARETSRSLRGGGRAPPSPRALRSAIPRRSARRRGASLAHLLARGRGGLHELQVARRNRRRVGRTRGSGAPGELRSLRGPL